MVYPLENICNVKNCFGKHQKAWKQEIRRENNSSLFYNSHSLFRCSFPRFPTLAIFAGAWGDDRITTYTQVQKHFGEDRVGRACA